MAIPTQRQIHAKLEVIRPNGTPVDVTDYLESIDIELGSIENLGTGTGADIGVRSLTAKLRNTPGKRFAPRDKTSNWNIVDGQWEPLLWPYRGIRFQVFPQRGVGPGRSLTDIVDSQADFAKGVFTNTKTLGGMVVLAEGATSGNWRKNINLSQVKYVQGSKIEWEAITDILYYDDQVSRDSEDVIGDSEDAIGDSEDSAAVFFNALFNTQAQTQQTTLTMQTRVNGGAWSNVTNGSSIPGLYEGQDVHASTLEVRAVMSAPAGFSPELHSVKVTVTWAPAWITLFEGYLGDNIRTEPHYVEIRCRDKSKRLQDAYIDVKKEYEGPISAEALIQAIINDYVDDPPTLHCPIPSGITFDKMVVEYVSVWDAIQNVAAQMGWYLGYLWNGAQYALTFIEPPRSKNTPDYQLTWTDDFYHESLDISDSNIRNVVTVTYRDKTSGERETVTVQNNDSIAQYTRRAMQIEEADTSLIDTQVKAQTFAEAVLWDLSELSATDYLDMPLFPQLDLFSTFTVENPLTSSTVDFYSVQSVRHSLNFSENGRFRTEVVATGRVVGGRSKWTNMETRPGRPGAPIDGDRIPPGELPADRLPDYSLGADKFVVGLKPPILVTSKPNFPDPRYPDDTILFYTVDSRLYRVVGNDWVPLTVTDFSELSGQIQSNQIALDAIKEDLIAAGAIANRHIQTDAVTSPKIASEAVKANHIEPGAVTAEKIAHEAVQTEHIDTEAITETKISDNAISAPKIKTGAIEADKIAANAVTATKIAANAVTANKIAAGAVETEKLAANAITAGKIAAGAIETNHISAGAVKADQIDANAVTATKILAGAVTADKIASNAVTAEKINAGAVTADKIAAGAIQTQHLAAGAVTADKLTVDETTTNKIIAGLIQAGGLSANQVQITATSDDGEVVVGSLEGKPWGEGFLPAGTFGIYGDQAGLYLRGYARLLTVGSAEDEEIIDLSDFSNVSNPEIIVAPKELVSYSPERDTLSHLYVDAVKVPGEQKYVVKAKTMVKGSTTSWGGRSETHASWSFVRPTESIDGKKGVYTNFFICRPAWRVASGGLGLYTAKLWMDITDQFNANGDPVNWQTIRTFSQSSSGSGTLNWDTALPHYGQWALRVRGKGGGALLVKYAFTRLVDSGYRTNDTYLDVGGNVIGGSDPANTPSGMSAIYCVFDRG